MGRQFHSYVSKYSGFIRFMIGIVMSFLYFFIRIGMSQMQQCEAPEYLQYSLPIEGTIEERGVELEERL